MKRFSQFLLTTIVLLSFIAGSMMVNERPDNYPPLAQTAAAYDSIKVLADKGGTPHAQATEVDHETGEGDDSASDGNTSDTDSHNNDDSNSSGPNNPAPNVNAAQNANCDNNGFDCLTATKIAPQGTVDVPCDEIEELSDPLCFVVAATRGPILPTPFVSKTPSLVTNTPGVKTPIIVCTPSATAQAPTNTPVSPTIMSMSSPAPAEENAALAGTTCIDQEVFWDVVPGENGDKVVRWNVVRRNGKVVDYVNPFTYDLSKAGKAISVSDISHEPQACGRLAIIINGSLWIINRDGSDLHQVKSGEFAITSTAVSWGPKDLIAVVESDSQQVWTVQPNGEEMSPLPVTQVANLDFSKDGTIVTFEQQDGTQGYIEVDTGEVTMSNDELTTPRWDPQQDFTCGDEVDGTYVCTNHTITVIIAVWADDGVIDPSGITPAAVLQSTNGLYLLDNVWAKPGVRSLERVADKNGTLPEWYVPEQAQVNEIDLLIPASDVNLLSAATVTAMPSPTPTAQYVPPTNNGETVHAGFGLFESVVGAVLSGLALLVAALFYWGRIRRPVAPEERKA